MLAIGGLKKRLFLALGAECQVRAVDNVAPVTTPGKPLAILTQINNVKSEELAQIM